MADSCTKEEEQGPNFSEDSENDDQQNDKMTDPDNLCIDGRPIADLKVVELRHELEFRNLPKSGKKNELIERLRNYLLNNEDEEQETQADDQSNTDSYKEYRSLTEVRPVSKSPTKSPLKSPSSSTETVSPAKTASKAGEEMQESTFYSAKDGASDFDTSDNVTAQSGLEKTELEAEPEISEDTEKETSQTIDDTFKTVDDSIIQKEENEETTTANDDDKAITPKSVEVFDDSAVSQVEEEKQQTVDNNETPVEAPKVEVDEADVKSTSTESVEGDSVVPSERIQDADVELAEQENKSTKESSPFVEGVDMNVEDDENMTEDDKHIKAGEEELDYEEEEEKKIDMKEEADEHDSAADIHQPSEDETASKDEKKDEASHPLKTDIVEAKIVEDAKPSVIHTPEGFVRRRAISPARNKPSEYLHIRNLKRPFTIKALKELLNNFGQISDDDFWIDSIKTNCIVKYETVEQAELARERLHHVVWPASSDTSLTVEFTRDEKLLRRKSEDTAKNGPAIATEPTNITVIVENRRNSSSKLEPAGNSELYVNSHKRKLPRDEPPPKQLDDLFKKTVTKPSVYYMPLNEIEAEKRWAERNVSTAAGRSNGHHRVRGSSRDAPRRPRQPSPPRKRERRDLSPRRGGAGRR